MSGVLVSGVKGLGGSRPRAVLLLLCLGAVLAGIVGMHLWTGGPGVAAAVSSATVSGHAHPAADTAVAPGLPALSRAHAPGDGGFPMPGCAGSCDAGDMAAGMCVLSLIVLALFVFPVPPANGLPRSLLRRGPPPVSRGFRLVPTPSLTQLCISRT